MNNILGVVSAAVFSNQVRSKAGCATRFMAFILPTCLPGMFYNYVATKNETAAKPSA